MKRIEKKKIKESSLDRILNNLTIVLDICDMHKSLFEVHFFGACNADIKIKHHKLVSGILLIWKQNSIVVMLKHHPLYVHVFWNWMCSWGVWFNGIILSAGWMLRYWYAASQCPPSGMLMHFQSTRPGRRCWWCRAKLNNHRTAHLYRYDWTHVSTGTHICLVALSNFIINSNSHRWLPERLIWCFTANLHCSGLCD